MIMAREAQEMRDSLLEQVDEIIQR